MTMRNAITALTLVLSMISAVIVSFGAVTVGLPDAQGSTAESTLAPSTSPPAPSALTPLSEVIVSSPAPAEGDDQAPAAPSPSPEIDRSAGTSPVSGASGSLLVDRPQAITPTAPLASQPAPFVVPSTAPSTTPSTSPCPAAITGTTPGAPSTTSPLGVAGTTSDDLQSFAQRYNEIRVANCLPPVPFANIRYDSCMEQRLFWMAEDPSTDPMSAWGHIGSQRSDGLPSVGCDGNLAGGSNNTGATVAQKWWDSAGHRTSLYKPTVTGSMANVCIVFAMTHGGIPNEPYSFVRAAARWITC